MFYKLKLFLRLLRSNPSTAASFVVNYGRETLAVRIAGRKFFQHNDPSALYHILNSYPKLQRMVKLLPQDVDGTIIDGGANNGLFSVLAARKFPTTKILACEPSPVLKPVLLKNFEGLNVEIVDKALTEKSGKLDFYFSESSDQVSSIFKNNVEVFGHKNVRGIQVDSISLADLMKEKGISKISVLKLDVQGAEFQILKTAGEVLRSTDYLILEMMFIEPSIFDIMEIVKKSFSHYLVINKVSYGADILFSKNPLGEKANKI